MLRWLPENVSTYGADIDAMFALIYYIVGFWFLLTWGVLLFFVFRYRRRAGHRAAYVQGERFRQAAWILVPAFIVTLLDLGIDFSGAKVWDKVKGRMPPGDGMNILSYARTHYPQAKVIIMTAFGSDAMRQRALAQGAHAFLSKPFSCEALLAILTQEPPSEPTRSAAGGDQHAP